MDGIVWIIVGGVLLIAWLVVTFRVSFGWRFNKRAEAESIEATKDDDGEWHFDRAHTRQPPK